MFRPFDITKHFTPITQVKTTWEHDYLQLLTRIMEDGIDRPDRTGTGTRAIFDTSISIDLSKGFPLVTTSELKIKSILGELLWFLEGSGDERRLCEITHGTRDESKKTIWTANSNASYWKHKAEFPGDLGRVYGVQWREWTNSDGQVFDQIETVLDQLVNDPYSRRIILTTWNPGELNKMCLPPCHVMAQFFVTPTNGKPKLSCKVIMRSVDAKLGKPYDLASYAALVHIFAHITNMDVGTLAFSFADTHIYANHFEQVEEQIARAPFNAPTLRFKDPETLTKISDFTIDSFIIEGYQSHPAIKALMAV